VINTSGTVMNHVTYDSFGRRTAETSSGIEVFYGFTGRPYDEDTGLQNNLNRWYDAGVGKWISEDPIGFDGGDANLNRYVTNQPAGQSDSFGLKQVALGTYIPNRVVISTLKRPKADTVRFDKGELPALFGFRWTPIPAKFKPCKCDLIGVAQTYYTRVDYIPDGDRATFWEWLDSNKWKLDRGLPTHILQARILLIPNVRHRVRANSMTIPGVIRNVLLYTRTGLR
jgi:RHS repeat-associated protein